MRAKHGFTLVELLVVIGIIAVLIAILLPALQRARYQATLTTELANARQFAIVMHMYTSESHGWYPDFRRVGFGSDDYVQVDIRAWDALTRYGVGIPYEGTEADRQAWAIEHNQQLNEASLGCVAWQRYAVDFPALVPGRRTNGNPADPHYYTTQMHWNVFVGRDSDYALPGSPVRYYQSPQKTGKKLTNSGRTMFNCRHYLTNQSWAGRHPHYHRNTFQITNTGQTTNPKPPPLGLVEAKLDGSASFVRWGDLQRLNLKNWNQTFIYHDPS